MTFQTISPPVGARRLRFVLQQAVDTSDGFGGNLRHYVDGPQIWAAIERLGAIDRVLHGRGDRIATHRIILRWRPGIDATMRLAAGTRLFAIRTVGDPDARRRDLVCEVEELIEETTP